jgi:hypothetical protein
MLEDPNTTKKGARRLIERLTKLMDDTASEVVSI